MNIFGILIILIIAIGGVIALIRIKVHKKPQDKIIIRLNWMDLIAKLYISVPFLILTILSAILLCLKIFTESYYYSFALILPVLSGFLSIPSLMLFRQYYNVEKNRIIELDPGNRKLIIKKQSEERVLLNTDIIVVEYFGAYPDKAPFDFEFLKITMKDGSKYILTNLLNDLSDFEPVFKGVKRKHNKLRIFNRINCN